MASLFHHDPSRIFWKRNMVWILAVFLCFTIYNVFFTDQIGIAPATDHLDISFPSRDAITVTVPFSELTDVALEQISDFGELTAGGNSAGYRWGTWKNEKWGSYTLCTSTKHSTCLVMITADATYVLNLPRKEDTRALYAALKEHLIRNGYVQIHFAS